MTDNISPAAVEARAAHIEHCYGVGHADAVMLRDLSARLADEKCKASFNDAMRGETLHMLLKAEAALATARADALIEAASAVLANACKHEGEANYSQCMDRMALDQIEIDYSTILALIPATPPAKGE